MGDVLTVQQHGCKSERLVRELFLIHQIIQASRYQRLYYRLWVSDHCPLSPNRVVTSGFQTPEPMGREGANKHSTRGQVAAVLRLQTKASLKPNVVGRDQ
jgi:hypothetical protein